MAPLSNALRQVHAHLVRENMRDQISIIVSGGIAAAEHVAKALVCGADGVAVDWILLVAWGCSLWADRGRCPVEQGELEAEWAAQRVVNLMAAWRDQLLEVMGNIVGQSTGSTKFRVSGQVSKYQNRNYMLVRMALVVYDTGNLGK